MDIISTLPRFVRILLESENLGGHWLACKHKQRLLVYVVLFFAHIPFVVNRTFNATPTQRL